MSNRNIIKRANALDSEAIEKINLGHTYFEDGASLSAARCLREAADLLSQAHELRYGALTAGASK